MANLFSSHLASITPRALRTEVILRALTPLSHHDAAVSNDSNVNLFNRQKASLPCTQVDSRPTQEQIDAFCQENRIPADFAPILATVAFPEFVAAALVRLFIDLYNSAEGTGLFEGPQRYDRLEGRLQFAAVRARHLKDLWDRLTQDLQVPIHPMRHDADLLRFFALPMGLQQSALRAAQTRFRSTVSVARAWHDARKLQDPEYAKKRDEPVAAPSILPHYLAEEVPDFGEEKVTVEIPHVTGNSLRHSVVRKPLYLHLFGALGLPSDLSGLADLPPGVEAFFVNGGNIAQGAKPPSNAFALALKAREVLPFAHLLGGTFDASDIGESALKVAGWIVCRENREALRGSPAYDRPSARVSVFDLIDEFTHTRQATERGEGQMIFNQEGLCPGTEILCRLTLTPYAPRLTQGALLAALQHFEDQMPYVGGQSARGYGLVGMERLRSDLEPQTEAEYGSYLTENRAALHDWLVDGTLGTGVKVLS